MSWEDWKSHQHLMRNEIGGSSSNGANSTGTSTSIVGRSEQHDALNEKDDYLSSGLLTNCAMIGRGALVKPWVTKVCTLWVRILGFRCSRRIYH